MIVSDLKIKALELAIILLKDSVKVSKKDDLQEYYELAKEIQKYLEKGV